MRQCDAGERGVEDLHHRAEAGRESNQPLPLSRPGGSPGGGSCHYSPLTNASAEEMKPGSSRWWPVSISTVTLIPARSGGPVVDSVSWSRTGTRCTTFTQLPVAFCAGRIENSAPVADDRPVITALQTRFGLS